MRSSRARLLRTNPAAREAFNRAVNVLPIYWYSLRGQVSGRSWVQCGLTTAWITELRTSSSSNIIQCVIDLSYRNEWLEEKPGKSQRWQIKGESP